MRHVRDPPRRVGAHERVLGAVPGLLRDSVRGGSGDGLGVLLVPGFGCGDQALALTGGWLRARGYRPAGARIGLTVGCTDRLVARVERRLAERAGDTGRRVVLLGHSRGGWLARLVAARRPELVRGLVTVGGPVLDPLGAHPHVPRLAGVPAHLSALGVPGLLDPDCLSGPCFRTHSAALAAALPPGVPALAVSSRLDRVAPWALCKDPSAECVEIDSGHRAMAVHPDFPRVLAPRFAEWAAAGQEPVSSPGAMSRPVSTVSALSGRSRRKPMKLSPAVKPGSAQMCS